MKTIRPLRLLLVLGAGAFVVPAFSVESPRAESERTLTEADAYLKEYGTALFSSVLPAKSDGDNFAFGLDLSAKDFFAEAGKRQGAAATSDQQMQSLAIAASLQVDPTQTAAYADLLQAYSARQDASKEIDRAKSDLARAKLDEALLAAEKEPDPDKKAAAVTKARSDYLADLSAGLSGPTEHPTADATKAPELKDPGAQAALEAMRQSIAGKQGFTATGGLLSSKDFSIRARDAMITAAGDRAVQGILNLFGKPEASALFTGRRVFFGTGVVSILPGWRSRLGYAAQVSIHMETVYTQASQDRLRALAANPDLDENVRLILLSRLSRRDRQAMLKELPDEQRGRMDLDANPKALAAAWADLPEEIVIGDTGAMVRSPAWLKQETDATTDDFDELVKRFGSMPRGVAAVIAASPFTESQNLDTQSSVRERFELALSLAAAVRSAGQEAQAKVLEQYVRQREADVATGAPDIAVTCFSAAGGMFGYEVGPSLRGLQDPANPHSRAGYVLQRQSFPVLLLCGLTEADTQPVVVLNHATRQIAVLIPSARLTQTCRWLPLKGPSLFRTIFPRRLEQEATRLQLADRLAQAEDCFTNSTDRSAIIGLYRTRGLIRMINGSVESMPIPTDASVPEPVFKAPVVDRILPESLQLETDDAGAPVPHRISVLLAGSNLSKATAASVQLQRPEQVTPGSLSTKRINGALWIEAEVRDATTPLIFTGGAEGDATGGRFYLAAVPVTLKKNLSISLAYDQIAKDDAKAIHRTLTITGSPPAAILAASAALIQGDKPAPATTPPVKDPGTVTLTPGAKPASTP